MKITQNWVGYADRSFEQIKASVLKRLPINNPEITDHTEGNILIIILSFFSGIGEMLNYYIDQMAREAFIGTARRFSSVVKLAKLVDYRGKASWYASVNLLFTLVDSNGNPIVATQIVSIPKGTTVTDTTGIIFITISDQIIPINQFGTYSEAVQYQSADNIDLGTTDGTMLQKFQLPASYVHDTLSITINSIDYKLFTSFGLMLSGTKGFIVDIEEDGNAYAIFGDGTNGAIPAIGFSVLGTYLITQGSSGNLPPSSINTITTPLVVPTGTSVNVNNPDYANAGADFEGIEDIRDRAPRSIRTLDRAVTYPDYIDVALQHPGVSAAEVSYCCGKYVDLYIIPKSKGVGTLGLLQNVKNFMDCRKMITTQIATKASGLSKIWIQAVIKAKPLISSNSCLIEVINQLDLDFGFEATKINRSLNVSDIIKSIESCSTVDSVAISIVRVLPYVRPSDTTNANLDIVFSQLPITTNASKYSIVYKSLTNTFQVYKQTTLVGEVAAGIGFNDGSLVFVIQPGGSYHNNDTWTFNVIPSYPEIFPDGEIDITDYSAPIIDIGPVVDTTVPRTIFSNLTVIEQTVQSSCLPPC